MSETADLDALLQEMQEHAECLAGEIKELRSVLCTAEPAPAAEPEQTEEPAPVPVSRETVRKVLADRAGAGYAAEIRTLLQRHGAEKLSLVDPAEYVALMAEAQQLGAAG